MNASKQRRLLVFSLIFSLSLGGVFGIGQNPARAVESPIVINEVDCDGNDWIEVFNRSSSPVEVSGWLLTDKSLNTLDPAHKYVFPPGTRIPASTHLVVQQSGSGDRKLPFGINCSKGGKIRLGKKLQNGGFQQVDEVYIPVIPEGASYGRYPNSRSAFEFTLPTKWSINKTIKPVLTSPTKYSCNWKKNCSFSITAKNTPRFTLVNAVPGVKITSDGKITLNTKTKKTYKFRIRLQNRFGSSISELEFKVK